MEILVRILIISDDDAFVAKLRDLVSHPQVEVDVAKTVPEKSVYNFYVLGESVHITEAVDNIKKHNEGSPIYLAGAVCDKNVPVRKMTKCNIIGCLENEEEMRDFVKQVSSFCKHRSKLTKAVSKLDCLVSGDLKALTRELKQTESDRFVDYIQNHSLPMVLVSCEYDVLHANAAMEKMIGTKLAGTPASTYWEDPELLDRAVFDLKKKGQVLGREATLKTINGELVKVKLYSSLHTDSEGNWLNTRCLFVPIDPD